MPNEVKLPGKAEIIIIGGGIVGCSIAYHLASKKIKNVVLVEQDNWPEPGGSTSHASDFIFPIDHSELMANLSQYGVEFYSNLKFNGKPCYEMVGGIELARTENRLRELRRKVESGKSWGIDAELISVEEAQEAFPFLDKDPIRGAMWTPTAGVATRSTDAAQAMVQEAKRCGSLQLFDNTEVLDVIVEDNKVCGVHTSRGFIQSNLVISAAGVWGPLIGKMAGISIPLAPMHHQLVHTGNVPELEGAKSQIEWPVLRDQDRSMYVRQEFDTWEIGSYNHPPMITDANDIQPQDETKYSPTMMPFTPEHFEVAMASIIEVMPILEHAPFQFGFNGLLSVTADSMPVIGESPKVKGFWAAEAVWVKDGPGVGKMIAEWIVDGLPSLDIHEAEYSRFHEHTLQQSYVDARASENFQKIYGIVHPQEQWSEARKSRLSPFYQRQEDLEGAFFETAGWERPQWYRSNDRLIDKYEVPTRDEWGGMWWSQTIGAEHQAVRETVGMFDLTPFVKIDVEGPEALAYLDHMVVKNLSKPVGTVVYTPLVNSRGGIIADLTVLRLGENFFRIITGASTGMRDLSWFRKHQPTNERVRISDVTSKYCCIGVWGPNSRSLLQSLCNDDLSNDKFPFATVRQIHVGKIPALAVRISYVGELGWEIYVPTEDGLALWDSLWNAGQKFDVLAAGIGSYGSSLRLEKGYRLWGQDIHSGFNPFEAGLMNDQSSGNASLIKRADFIGRDSLLHSREQGVLKRLSCMTFDEPGVSVMGKEPIIDKKEVVGYVTSSDYGYTVGSGIAYGYLPLEYCEPGTSLMIDYLGKHHTVTVSREPLYDPENVKLLS